MCRTLIIEDSIFFRQLLKETLHSRFPSMNIAEAENGKEALKKVKSLQPHLIFMDIKLPGENGLELTRTIKARYPNISIIILTSYDLPEYQEAARKNQADHFLSKGRTAKEDILTLVQSIISEKNIDH